MEAQVRRRQETSAQDFGMITRVKLEERRRRQAVFSWQRDEHKRFTAHYSMHTDHIIDSIHSSIHYSLGYISLEAERLIHLAIYRYTEGF